MDALPPEPRRASGCALALGLGALTVLVVSSAFSLIARRPLNLADEWPNFLAQTLGVAAPFGLLALAGISDRRPWLVGLALTAGFWGYYLYAGLRYQLGGARSGVDFGLIFLMLASPAIISAGCFMTALALRRRR